MTKIFFIVQKYTKLLSIFIFFGLFIPISKAQKKEYFPDNPSQNNKIPPPAPNYALESAWAAHPNKKDAADKTPSPTLKDNQQEANVDVFFLHPTTYTTKKAYEILWNAPVDNPILNKKTDDGTILNQASIFNGAGRVFAPYYRQAHIRVFFPPKLDGSEAALDTAYSDLKKAFLYYLAHYNNGRPFIIAAHSQGTTHAVRLVKELIDGKALQQQLIAAYLVGMPVPLNVFKNIKICESPDEIGCFCSWRTFRTGFTPKVSQENIAVTNPLTWTTSETYADSKLNKGEVILNFKLIAGKNDAQIKDGILWTNKPKFRGSLFYRAKNYHVGDFNLFYMNIRENAQQRAASFLRK